MKYTDLLQLIGYAISAVHYLAHGKLNSGSILVGTILVVVGYGILALVSMLTIYTESTDTKRTESTESTETEASDKWSYIGYASLLLFFFGSFFLPLTYNVENYDWFAVAGYTLLIASAHKLIQSKKPGYMMLVAYYLCGAHEASGAILYGRLSLALSYILGVLG